jgi:protein-tyrosine-phosphatase
MYGNTPRGRGELIPHKILSDIIATMNLDRRAAAHAALGDERRLHIVDTLSLGDRTFAELADLVGVEGNLLAHHLEVLENAQLIQRRVSDGDQRRRYVSLMWEGIPPGIGGWLSLPDDLAFICTHNSARSQFAAALWEQRTSRAAQSAGSLPADRVHPKAVRVAAEFGVDLSSAHPGGYERIRGLPDLIVSVCDRALEGGVPAGRSHLHWSIPDPVAVGTLDAFRSSFSEIAARVGHLADQGNAKL